MRNRLGCIIFLALVFLFSTKDIRAQKKLKFNAVGFYTGKFDSAHLSFLAEAHPWFFNAATKHNFHYDTTSNWDNLNAEYLKNIDVIIFLDTRPEAPQQRLVFEQYMKNGGAWMGFHFAAFALNKTKYPQNWDWYHNDFLGVGEYKSNTWRPTAAILRVEDRKHPAMKGIPHTFKSTPSEWYRWNNDITLNGDINILLAVDPSSFPLGTGPKPHEIWHSGYYPIAWTNNKYRMIYFNFGHNDMDYPKNQALSKTFGNPVQDRIIIQSLLWLGQKKRTKN